MGIARGGPYFEDPVINVQQGHIKRPAAQIKHQYGFFLILFIESIRNGRRRGFIDDAFNFETGNFSRILGGLSLGIVEIGRYRDHGPFDGLANVRFGRFFHFPQHHATQFFWSKGDFGMGLVQMRGQFEDGFPIGIPFDQVGEQGLVGLDGGIGEFASNQTLDIKKGSRGIGRGLILGGIAHES
mmetsp:Transcript_9799/g.18927  ORF Transcript_9799/g.18927 Transcript_9799/m.18927 type:complete len:184 (-) Transcript_9799:281-832(-)|eukprot:scaffold2667_cov237-Amphora_coffeaeformis.AAC.8